MTRWAILTGEYPPQPGGVSDYTRLVAAGLAAAGDAVSVFAPAHPGPDPADSRVIVRRLPDHFGPRGLASLDHALYTRPRPDRILIQYVPHAFGWKALNLPFAAWVAARARRLAPVWVMFHEVVFPFYWRPVAHAVLGAGTRLTARLVAGTADRVFVAIPAWGPILRRVCPRVCRPEWLPVPSNLPTEADSAVIAAVRHQFAPDGGPLVGHFGTYGSLITDLLAPAAARFLDQSPTARLALIGRNSEAFRERFVAAHPLLAGRVGATGEVPPDHLPAHLRACDLVVQPYPDGVSTRRTSVMAALANGVPVVTNLGALSEPVWADGKRVWAAAGPDPAAVADAATAVLETPPATRAARGRAAADWYRERFAVERIIGRLRAAAGSS